MEGWSNGKATLRYCDTPTPHSFRALLCRFFLCILVTEDLIKPEPSWQRRNDAWNVERPCPTTHPTACVRRAGFARRSRWLLNPLLRFIRPHCSIHRPRIPWWQASRLPQRAFATLATTNCWRKLPGEAWAWFIAPAKSV